MKRKKIFYIGISIPIVFWVTTFICGFMQNNYNHFTRMVSELGEIGTKSQFFFTTGLVICSALSVLFVIELRKTCKISKISAVPIVVILSFSVSIAGAAIFPLPLKLHLIMGMPSILLIFSPLMSLILWKNKIPLNIIMSLISLLIMSIGFSAFMPEILSNYPGLNRESFMQAGRFGLLILVIYSLD